MRFMVESERFAAVGQPEGYSECESVNIMFARHMTGNAYTTAMVASAVIPLIEQMAQAAEPPRRKRVWTSGVLQRKRIRRT